MYVRMMHNIIYICISSGTYVHACVHLCIHTYVTHSSYIAIMFVFYYVYIVSLSGTNLLISFRKTKI